MQNIFYGVREYLTPVLHESLFLERGVLTPEEFVQAGDQLIAKCPTWQWQSGDGNKLRPYLPQDKQYLLTTEVPCRSRVSALESEYVEETEINLDKDYDASGALDDKNEDGWLATHTNHKSEETAEELDDISVSSRVEPSVHNILGAVVDGHFDQHHSAADEEYADLSTFEEDNLVTDDATLSSNVYLKAEEPDDLIVPTRRYDISISYDKYYQTPRVWIFGYNEASQPLTAEQIFQDIMQDYANRTVTIEPHPHTGLPHASIHPCQHAAVMKRIIDCLGKNARTDQYLFIFLKFIQSVIPTIDYDHTLEVQVGRNMNST